MGWLTVLNCTALVCLLAIASSPERTCQVKVGWLIHPPPGSGPDNDIIIKEYASALV